MKPPADALKNAPKKEFQRASDKTRNLIGNKNADEIIKVVPSKTKTEKYQNM